MIAIYPSLSELALMKERLKEYEFDTFEQVYMHFKQTYPRVETKDSIITQLLCDERMIEKAKLLL